MGDEWRVASGEWWVGGGGWGADPTSSELHHPPPLSIGWISDLFAKDELDAILGGIAGEAKNAGVPDLPQDRFNFLVRTGIMRLHDNVISFYYFILQESLNARAIRMKILQLY